MATKSSIGSRTQIALCGLRESCKELSSIYGIENADDVPTSIRDPALKETVALECWSDFLKRLVNAARASNEPKKKVKHEQSKRLDTPEASG